MARLCECNIVAEFPVLKNLGIISANLTTSTEVSVTEAGVSLIGATSGDLAITAYAPISDVLDVNCPGRAGVSFNWDRRTERGESCIGKTHFIPRGQKAYTEGSKNKKISMVLINSSNPSKSLEASAAGGPSGVYRLSTHFDGHTFSYTGSPIAVSARDGRVSKIISIFTDSSILPASISLYLQSFSWTYTPPNVPTVSYSFIFARD